VFFSNDLRKQINHSHIFIKAVNEDLAFEVYVWGINFMLELLRRLVVIKARNLYAKRKLQMPDLHLLLW
jgi:hypothetical protein